MVCLFSASNWKELNNAYEGAKQRVNNAVVTVKGTTANTARTVRLTVKNTIRELEKYVPNVIVIGGDPDGEFYEPRKDAPNIVIENEDLEDIKDAAGATSKDRPPSSGTSEERVMDATDNLNDVENNRSENKK